MNNRELFFKHIGQTSPFPLAIEISKAEGVFIEDTQGKKYIDFISGIAVSNVGHCHPDVIKAITEQANRYMHTMVYGEYIQSPQVQLAHLLSSNLPSNLQSVYFVNSGAEAIDGALKLAKRYTKRTELISFKNSYHGSTHGPLSIMGSETYKNAFRPLLPNTKLIEFNKLNDLEQITHDTACVVVEPIQGEAGVILPENDYLQKLQKKCNQTGALLIVDEIQTGCGRTGSLWAFESYQIIPDILCLAKGLGGGMPIGAFISSNEIMSTLTHHPILGHITTFGGHPVCCAASFASLSYILNENLAEAAKKKGEYFLSKLIHPIFQKRRGKGLMISIPMDNNFVLMKFIQLALERGIIVDWFLFADSALRICPPLIISQIELDWVAEQFNQIAELLD
ncbi:MAG: aspartate aminotransferase family protein [Bacteroidia bacterium]|nr:aspartate aminotransferase family protein [Bacteroidia bacterium]